MENLQYVTFIVPELKLVMCFHCNPGPEFGILMIAISNLLQNGKEAFKPANFRCWAFAIHQPVCA